jgi:hypothetical protein
MNLPTRLNQRESTAYFGPRQSLFRSTRTVSCHDLNVEDSTIGFKNDLSDANVELEQRIVNKSLE